MLIEEQFALLGDDLLQRYDDEFIETCAPWVIPYIGDLIGYQPVNGVAPAVASPRAEVANTVSMRRRKGTVLVLEQLARDVTGWGAHAVEFFKYLATSQYLKHLRLQNHYAPDLRGWRPRVCADSAFDMTAHQLDVRRIADARGRYNVQNIGVFLWSLVAYGVVSAPATAVDGSGQLFRLGTLGIDLALFNDPVSQGTDVTTAATPLNVPDRLRRPVLQQDLASGVGSAYYGPGRSVTLFLNGTLLNPYQIQICDLSGADGSWSNLPAAGSPYVACFDPELGRLALVTALTPAPVAGSTTSLLQATYFYGFAADSGGGDYDRADSFMVPSTGAIFPYPDTAATPRYASLQAAINYATSALPGAGQAAIEILDDGVYPLQAAPALTINVPAGATLELRAAQGFRPTLLIGGEITVTGGAQSTVALNGLLIGCASGSTPPAALVHVPASANQLGTLALSHCTLVPGSCLTSSGSPQPGFAAVPSVLVEEAGLAVTVERCILGALWVSGEATATLSDSIVDATSPALVAYAAADGSSGGGGLSMTACTVIGTIHAALLTLLSGSIVLAGGSNALTADRVQQGCVRFSYLPANCTTPPQFECIVEAVGVPRPIFYSLAYGDPGYGKLVASTDDAIRRGAEDEGEMGAFHFLLAPQRENDLLVRLAEYIPAGLEFGIFYQN